MPSQRTGLLIIRAWLEPGSTEPLRAHIRVTSDISTGIERTVALAESDTVMELVDEWLQAMVEADETVASTDS
jgi:hypothetical protein